MLLNRILDFIEGRYVHCPRCLTRLPIRSQVSQDVSCAECQFAIPLAYIRGCRNAPPVFVQLFGLTAAGKTTFLDMLRLHLYDMDQVWESSGFYTESVTQLDVEHKVTLLNERTQGIMPGSTSKRDRDQNEVYIMSLMRMVRWDSRFLVLMDHSGEQFGELKVNVKEIPFLQQTPVTILLFSLSDLIREGKSVDDLVTSYITSLREYGVDFAGEGRQLVIVFSKADMISNLPPELHSYLSSDTIYSSLKKTQQSARMADAEMNAYIYQMGVIDGIIRNWVRDNVRGGAGMLNMLDDRGISARFTVMSATGHPISKNKTPLAPTPRRVLDPFFWVLEYYKHLGPQDVVPANLNTILSTFSPALRAVGALFLIFLLLFGTIEGGLYAAHLSQGSPGFVGFCLSLVLLFVCTLAKQRNENPNPTTRAVLNGTRLAVFLSCLVLQTLPSVQQVLTHLKLYQILGIFIVGSALFSCFQPATRLAAQSRVTLAAIAAGGALLQYVYGFQLEIPDLPFIHPNSYETINSILIWVLVAGALFSLLLTTKERIWLDRIILFLVAVSYGGWQFAYGPQEIFNTFPSTFHAWENIVFVNNMAVFIVVIALPLSLFILYRFPRLDCLPLLILAVVSAYMLNALGDGITIPIGKTYSFSLAHNFVDLLVPGQIIAYGLIAVGLVMGIRFLFPHFQKEFTFLDHAALFFTAFVCAQMQLFPWRNPVQHSHTSTFPPVLLMLNRILANSLTMLVFVVSTSALLILLLPFACQVKQIERIVETVSKRAARFTNLLLWLERLIAFGTTTACALLAFLYARVLPDTFLGFPLGNANTFYDVVAVVFAIFALITLCRIAFPFRRVDRLLLLMNIFFCTGLYIVRTNPPIPLSHVLQGWNEAAYHSSVPGQLFALLLVLIALISLWWSTRCTFSGDRRLLHIVFGLALLCGLLQLVALSLFFTLLALVALIIGMAVTMIATRVETQ